MINSKIALTIIAGIAIVAAFSVYFVSLGVGVERAIIGVGILKEKGPFLMLPVAEYDFGEIKQSGLIVSADFKVKNSGTEEVLIEKILTSCNCASAKIDKKTLKSGETAVLTVSFDPNYHFESYEQIMRTIVIYSNALNEPRPEIKIYAKVDYDLGVDKTKYGVDKH